VLGEKKKVVCAGGGPIAPDREKKGEEGIFGRHHAVKNVGKNLDIEKKKISIVKSKGGFDFPPQGKRGPHLRKKEEKKNECDSPPRA